MPLQFFVSSACLCPFRFLVILTVNIRVFLYGFNMFFLHTYANVTKTA